MSNIIIHFKLKFCCMAWTSYNIRIAMIDVIRFIHPVAYYTCMPYIDLSCASIYMLSGVGLMKRLQLADDRQFCMSLD